MQDNGGVFIRLEKAENVLNHPYTGYLLQAALIVVLLLGNIHVFDRLNTLESDGCKAYYSKFNGVDDFSDKRFFSEDGWKEFQKERRSLGYSGSVNYSEYNLTQGSK